MTRDELYAFMTAHRWAVEATVAPSGAPQAAVIGFAATRDLELVFDTLKTSRKYQNMLTAPKMALVIGWDDAQTLQVEGVADEPKGAALDRLKARYFEGFPDGREREAWTDITYVRVKPEWFRYSDFRVEPPKIVELRADRI
jgi:pyridoxine/pyridoxamine 5'-phosphate oxidase